MQTWLFHSIIYLQFYRWHCTCLLLLTYHHITFNLHTGHTVSVSACVDVEVNENSGMTKSFGFRRTERIFKSNFRQILPLIYFFPIPIESASEHRIIIEHGKTESLAAIDYNLITLVGYLLLCAVRTDDRISLIIICFCHLMSAVFSLNRWSHNDRTKFDLRRVIGLCVCVCGTCSFLQLALILKVNFARIKWA